MGLLEWVGIGVIMLVAGVISVRIMRRGLPTYAEDRKKYMEHMAVAERQIQEDRKQIPAREQLRFMRAALEDFLRLESIDGEVTELGNVLTLQAGDTRWTLELLMRERMLASSNKVIHGQGRWLLCGPHCQEEYVDCARLMASLNAHWHHQAPEMDEPEFVSRRLAHSRRQWTKKLKN